MIEPIRDVVIDAGVARLNQLERSNLNVARQLGNFSKTYAMPDESGRIAESAQQAKAPDMGKLLVTLTQNSMGYSVASKAMSYQLSLYSAVISEGKA